LCSILGTLLSDKLLHFFIMLGQLLFLGIKGTELTLEEAELFRKIKPGGFILFTRNISSAAQVRKLTDDLRSLTYDDPFIARTRLAHTSYRRQPAIR